MTNSPPTARQSMSDKIGDEHVLPCDFVVGHMRFGKGVKLETVRRAAERWFKIASGAYFKPDPVKVAELDKMLAEITAENIHPEI